MCSHRVRLEHAGNNRGLTATWTYPQEFSSGSVVPAFSLPVSSARYSTGLSLNNLARPFTAAGAGFTTAALYVWDNSQPFVSGHWIEVEVMAIGYWR